MNILAASTLRDQLRQRTDEEVTIEEMREMGPRQQTGREPMSARDYLRFLYAVRLEGTLERSPERHELHAKLRCVIASLKSVPAGEPVFSWSAVTPSRQLSGISSPSVLILYGPDFVPETTPDA